MLNCVEPDLSGDGVAVATSQKSHIDQAVAEIRAALPAEKLALLIVYFAARYDAGTLAKALNEAFPAVVVIGCSTAGEMTPAGITDDTIVAIGLAEREFAVTTRLLPEISTLSMREIHQIATDAARELRESGPPPGKIAGIANSSGSAAGSGNSFALLLVDGACHLEEKLVSALPGGLLDIPLIGGSAADGLRFLRPYLLYQGQAHTDAAILTLITCRFPVMMFSLSHFSPTPVKLVVTRADVEKRIVKELNGAPAAVEYAAAVGLEGKPLSPRCFASRPVVVCVGGGYYVRSIQQVNDDGSLSFLCAIDEGIVFSLAQANDIIGCAERTFDEVRSRIGVPRLVLGFECVLRRIEAELQQTKQQLSKIYKENNVVGFHTYGEQFRTLHLNQTFSGVAIGR